ncbi:MAG: fumarylacetoacetate hydrolase family protein [Synergistota bacterium]|nr:fumarylacetoacetate hydrolase family protein [Synergistota bacterium]OPZ39388.1 MAG: Ureidoglycolate lyase [Synergistetes bacterium ADurb.BinA166]
MKRTFVRCVIRGEERLAMVDGEELFDFGGAAGEGAVRGGRIGALGEIDRYLPPCSPSKVVAVGLNYRDHAEEVGKPLPEEPLLFLKPSTSVVAHLDPVVYPPVMTRRVDYEAELAIVIGKRCKGAPPERALDFVLGYTCANDVTARDLQGRDGQWTRAKSFDTFCPLGPFLVCGVDPSDLEVKMLVNDRVVQRSRTSNLIFPVPVLVSHISHVTTLLPGDVIITGTPSGIGPVNRGDVMRVEIEELGALENRVE